MLTDFTETQRKLVIIDYNNMMYRNLYVAFKTDPLDEKFVFWKYQMVNSLFWVLKNHLPDEVVVAADIGSSWRKQRIWDGYKAKRNSSRESSPIDFEKFFAVEGEFWNQISSSFANWKWLRLNGIEADDIIATVTKNEPNKEIICISTDKDFQQLYRRKNFRQYNAVKRDWMDCMNPDIALQIKVLTGDSSDNIPPVKRGVGIKTAQKMINGGTVDLFLSDPIINENYVRNKALIDMDMIPEDIQQGIMENYNLASGNFDGRGAFKFLTENTPNLIDNAQEFFSMAKRCTKV